MKLQEADGPDTMLAVLRQQSFFRGMEVLGIQLRALASALPLS